MPYITPYRDDPFSIDAEATRELGKELADTYAAGEPFPHIVIDDFLPRQVIDFCLENFPASRGANSMSFDRDQERYKTSYNPDDLEPHLRSLFHTFNSRPFIKVIENISGIKGLIPDPYFLGGGFHEIATGGHLSVHADFNHHKLMNLERRINILIYLNDDWDDAYGGQLELWDQDMAHCVKSIVPLANRAAMFTTTGLSYHGNPQPVNHPEGRTRKSIALYYYTSTWDESKRSKTTQFKARTGTEDKTDWQVRTRELLEEFLPPVLARPAVRLSKKFSRT